MPNWCTNLITVEGTPVEVDRASAKIINTETGEVDFGIVEPMPALMYGAYSFDVDKREISFIASNPSRLGLGLLKYFEPVSVDTKTIELLAGDTRLDPDKSIEDNIRVLVSQMPDSAWVGAGKYNILMRPNQPGIDTLRTLLGYVRNDHEDWCIDHIGCKNWYDWANSYWGTKWNSVNTQIVQENIDDKQNVTTLIVQFDSAWAPPRIWFESLVSDLHKENVDVSIELEYGEEGVGFGGRLSSCPGGTISSYEFNEDELSEFLYGDSDYHKHEQWYAAGYADEDLICVEEANTFNDHMFTEAELEGDDE